MQLPLLLQPDCNDRCPFIPAMMNSCDASADEASQQQKQPLFYDHGRYQICHELNRGGTAVVYEAIDHQQGDLRVALKVLHLKPDGTTLTPLAAVRREIEHNRKMMTHPNIIQLHAVLTEANPLAMVFELVQGMDLLDFINSQPGGYLEEEDARHYFIQLMSAVCFIHQHGLCHRDLKAENLMIDTQSEILKVIDFGLSRRLESAQNLGIGTPDYMAPEIIADARVRKDSEGVNAPFDPSAVDVWAMGVILYLTVAGQYPFENADLPGDMTATLMNICAGSSRPLPAHVSADCSDLIGGMMEREPEARLTLDQIVHHRWLARARASGRSASSPGHEDAPASASEAPAKAHEHQPAAQAATWKGSAAPPAAHVASGASTAGRSVAKGTFLGAVRDIFFWPVAEFPMETPTGARRWLQPGSLQLHQLHTSDCVDHLALHTIAARAPAEEEEEAAAAAAAAGAEDSAPSDCALTRTVITTSSGGGGWWSRLLAS